jgi:hypothetical protein
MPGPLAAYASAIWQRPSIVKWLAYLRNAG